MGEFSCGSGEGYGGPNRVQEFCAGSKVTNKAVSGSTAWQWRAGGELSAADAFSAAGSDVTHVWLSVGGNDFMTPAETGAPGGSAANCQISMDDLAIRMQEAVTATRDAAINAGISNVKIVMIGYCVPHVPECGGSTDMTTLLDAFEKIAADNSDVTFHDISSRCGGSSPNVKGEKEYFVGDGLHLNKRGYCAAITESSVQSAFGCNAASYSCSSVGMDTCADAPGGNDSNPTSDEDGNILPLVAAVIGGLLGFVLLVGLAFFMRKKISSRARKPEDVITRV
eukprot:g2561.t1